MNKQQTLAFAIKYNMNGKAVFLSQSGFGLGLADKIEDAMIFEGTSGLKQLLNSGLLSTMNAADMVQRRVVSGVVSMYTADVAVEVDEEQASKCASCPSREVCPVAYDPSDEDGEVTLTHVADMSIDQATQAYKAYKNIDRIYAANTAKAKIVESIEAEVNAIHKENEVLFNSLAASGVTLVVPSEVGEVVFNG
jgi:hypothetical protein